MAQPRLPAQRAMMDSPVQSRWHCWTACAPCSAGSVDGRSAFGVDGTAEAACASCRMGLGSRMLWFGGDSIVVRWAPGSGGWTIRFEAVGNARAPCHACSGGWTVWLQSSLPALRALRVREGGQSLSWRMALPAHHAMRVRADGRNRSGRTFQFGVNGPIQSGWHRQDWPAYRAM